MYKATYLIKPTRITSTIPFSLNPFWLRKVYPNLKDRGNITIQEYFYGKSSVRVFTSGLSETMARALLEAVPPHLDKEFPGLKAVILLQGKKPCKKYNPQNGLLEWVIDINHFLEIKTRDPDAWLLPNLTSEKKLKESLESHTGQQFPDILQNNTHLLLQEVGLVPYEPYASGKRSLLDEWFIHNLGFLRTIGRKTFIYCDAENEIKALLSVVHRKAKENGLILELQNLISRLSYEEKGKLFASLGIILSARGWEHDKNRFFCHLINLLDKEKVNHLWDIIQGKIMIGGIPRDIFLQDIEKELKDLSN